VIKVSEAAEQEALVQWLALHKIPCFAAPSSFFSGRRDGNFYGMLNKLKAAGWSKGFVDIIIFLPGKTLYIEMKRSDGGTVSKEQREWHKTLKDTGNSVYVCKGFNGAVDCIKQHTGD